MMWTAVGVRPVPDSEEFTGLRSRRQCESTRPKEHDATG